MSVLEVFNPHVSHSSGTTTVEDRTVPGAVRRRELHSVIAIGLATFIGSMLAGSILLAINFRRLGKRDRVLPTLAAGMAATAVVLGIGFALPAGTPGLIFVAAQVVIARLVATKTQGQ